MLHRCGAHFCYRCGAPWQTKCTQGCELWDEDMLLAEEDRVRQHNAAARCAVTLFAAFAGVRDCS